jgi:hypothetical protein
MARRRRARLLASVAQLLQARAVVNALLRRARAATAAAPTSSKEPTDAQAIDALAAATTRRGCAGEALRTEQQQAIRAPLARLISPLVLAQHTPLPEEHPNELVEQNHVVACLALGGRL